MENEATTKTPIPTISGCRNFALCILIFALSNPLSVCLFAPLCLSGQDSRSTLVEAPLQIDLFFAKQSQFSQRQNQRNPLCRKGLPKQTTPGHSKKTKPIEPNQTQFQNGQYKHKYGKNKGLCQRTTNNEQQRSFKTNPIKPNPGPKLELCSTLSEVEGPIKPNSPGHLYFISRLYCSEAIISNVQ